VLIRLKDALFIVRAQNRIHVAHVIKAGIWMKVNVSDALNQNNACLFLCKAEIFSNVIKTSIQLILLPTVFLILSSIAPIIPIKVTV